MLESFARDLRSGQPDDLTRAARRALTVGFLVLAAPGLPLGGLYLLTRPVLLGAGWVVVLVLVAALLAGVALHLARLAARNPLTPAPRAALTAAMQAGTAPAVPFLLGCAALNQPAALAGLWAIAALAFAAAWAGVPGWVRSATSRVG